MAGLEPAPQGLEGPQAAVTPHSLWFGLADATAEHGPVSFTGPSTCVGCQRPRSCELDTSRTARVGDSARIRTWIRCRRHFTSRPFRRQDLPVTWPALSCGREAKTKKAF